MWRHWCVADAPYGWGPNTLLAHELGHIWDNRTGDEICGASICGGGMSDNLVTFLGGELSRLRFYGGINGMPMWENDPHKGYGNNSTADYFAEAFVWSIYDPSQVPSVDVTIFIEIVITLQTNQVYPK